MLPSLNAKLAPGALALFKQGRLTECVQQLRGSQHPDDILLLAEALLRLGRHNEVVRVDFLKVLAEVPTNRRYAAQALLSAGFFRSEMREQGEQALRAAYDSLDCTNDPLSRHWVDCYAAREYWSLGDFERSERLLRSIPMERGVLAARSLALLSWVEGSRCRFQEQITLLRRAWDVLPLHEDVQTGARIIHALSHLAWELYSPELAAFVTKSEADIPWSDDLAFEHVEVLRAVAWLYAMDGKVVPALRQLRANERMIANPATQMLTALDRARISYAQRELANYETYLQIADDLSQRVNWANSTGEERFGLLTHASLYAPLNADYARDILTQYQRVIGCVPNNSSWGRGDIRREAAEEYAQGVVARFQHNREAITHLRKAFSVYKRIGYLWRACLCAYNILEMTDDRHIRQSSLIWIRERFPHAWFTPLFSASERLATDPDYAKLGWAQREVFHMLLRGDSYAHIAETLDREEKTIRNHVSVIFRAFGVRMREDLVQIANQRGLT